MIRADKLQYYTMAYRLRGYSVALDKDRHEALVHMLMKAAGLLEQAWEEYQTEIKEKNNGI